MGSFAMSSSTVKEKFNVELETEVKYLGQW